MNDVSAKNIQVLTKALKELKKNIVLKETEFPIQLVTHFVTTNELFEQVLKDTYWKYFHEQDVPEDAQVATVITELTQAGIVPVSHAHELFDQYTTTSFFANRRWFESQPGELPFLQDCIEKIPTYHASMVSFIELLSRLDSEIEEEELL